MIDCPVEHSRPTNRGWWFSDDIEIGVLIKSNGVQEHRVRCTLCGRESSGIGKRNYEYLTLRGFIPTWCRTDEKLDTLRCVVNGCTQTGFEMHHFAPRNIFHDSDDWPYLPLCRMHHQHWHQMMDGYRWNRKAPQLNTEPHITEMEPTS